MNIQIGGSDTAIAPSCIWKEKKYGRAESEKKVRIAHLYKANGYTQLDESKENLVSYR